MMAVVGFNYGDMIIQFVIFIILVGIISFVFKSSKRNKQLNRIEEKLDQLLSDKEK